MEKKVNLVKIKNEVNKEIANKETLKSLMDTTFKGLQEQMVKRAIMEGMMRGFTFKDFLEKNVYAIPFKDQYSLVTSIDFARKIGMRSGVAGKSAPIFEEDENGSVISCSITIKRKVGDYIGSYSETVYFKEYTTGRNLWVSKPRTMLAKVAEMHALRMACPEELSQMYVEEEFAKEKIITVRETVDLNKERENLNAVKTMDELKVVWLNMPAEAKAELGKDKNKIKDKLVEKGLEIEAKKVETNKNESK